MKTDWPVKKLEEVADFQKGKMMPNSSLNTAGSAPYILIDDLRSGSYAHFTQSNLGTACLPTDSLLVWDGANAGTVGGNLQGFVGSTISKITPSQEMDPSFLNLLLSSKSGEFNRQVHGAAIPHLNKDFVHNMPIIIPPLSLQKKIAERLDAVRKAQELCDQQIKKTEELFESTLCDIFNKIKKIQLKSLEEIVKLNSGGTPSRQNNLYWTKGEVPWYSSGELNDDYTISPKEYITTEGLQKSNAKLFPKGALLIGMYDTAALKMSILDRKAAFNQAIAGIVPNSNVNLKFIMFYLKFKKEDLLKLRVGIRQRNLSLDKIKKIKVPILSNLEQQKIVEKLEAVQNYKKLLQKEKALLKELFDSVLDKSMRGELDA